jgi:carboxypeptidase Taq
MRRAWQRAAALPVELVEARARLETSCEGIWRGAKAADDFAAVRSELEALLGVVREEAGLLGAALGLSPYDALMDGFQPGITLAEIDPVFARYEAFLRTALPEAEARQARGAAPLALPSPVPEEAQERVCRRLAEAAGLDWSHARLDRSLHPFCGGTPDDVRITTRYDVDDPSRALLGVLHETGHALYERGLPAEWRRQPVGRAAGMAAHESQSLIVEMQACRSDAYLGWLGPVLAAEYGGAAAAYAPDNLGRLWRRVERSLIRVDADELTYPAHVILRLRLERALIDGSLAVRDLPGAWSDGLSGLLGVRPGDDRSGCLQDIHWYAGLFGYFPSYSLGAMAAAQLMAAAREALPDLDGALSRGDPSGLVGWLRAQVHGHGARLGFNALLETATGRPLDPAAFEAHLRSRYLEPARA